jgi:hypothetical protein
LVERVVLNEEASSKIVEAKPRLEMLNRSKNRTK